jgi:hypothetical protein
MNNDKPWWKNRAALDEKARGYLHFTLHDLRWFARRARRFGDLVELAVWEQAIELKKERVKEAV